MLDRFLETFGRVKQRAEFAVERSAIVSGTDRSPQNLFGLLDSA
jgi:hypothetical protein